MRDSTLEPDVDVAASAFAHMEIRAGHVLGVPARIARVSFTGELQYEISVPARHGDALMRALVSGSAQALGARPVGMEAWLRLRLEKGYVHLGSDTNGRTTPLDMGMAEIVAKRKADFIGKRSLRLAFALDQRREQFVGLVALDGPLRVGGRILAPGHGAVPCPTEGYVTSACVSPSMSPALGGAIGLALLERGRERHGDTVLVYDAGGITRCRVCEPRFYDANNERLMA